MTQKPLPTTSMNRMRAGLALSLGLFSSTFRGAEPITPQLSWPADPTQAECYSRLATIYDGFQGWRRSHGGAFPRLLSDLARDGYISDIGLLVCPLAELTGDYRQGHLEFRRDGNDPHSVYHYEFSPTLCRTNVTGGIAITERELKTMTLKSPIGHRTPIFRCLKHRPAINVALSGLIYENGRHGYWETRWRHLHAVPYTAPTELMKDYRGIPERAEPRNPSAPPALIDISQYYTAMLADSWSDIRRENHLGELQSKLVNGVGSFHQVRFDVRGVIQLDGVPKEASSMGFPIPMYPESKVNITINQLCDQIHFLQATLFPESTNRTVAEYIVHYANGEQVRIPLRYGIETTSWRRREADSRSDQLTGHSQVAWYGKNPDASSAGEILRLLVFTWTNPFPDQRITAFDFHSGMTVAAPFLLGVTTSGPDLPNPENTVKR